MKKNFFFLSAFIMAMMGMSCNGIKATGDASDSDSTAIDSVQTDDGKHNKEYIIQRLNDIYKLQDDSKCCSERRDYPIFSLKISQRNLGLLTR